MYFHGGVIIASFAVDVMTAKIKPTKIEATYTL